MRINNHPCAAAERTARREAADARCRQCLTALILSSSILRTFFCVLVPLAGSAACWLLPVCLLQGFLIYAALRLLLYAAGTETVSACIQRLAGHRGVFVFWLIKTGMLLSEAVLSVYTLRRVFTETVSTEGTAWTVTLLIGLAFFFSAKPTGVPRAVSFLRWVMLAMLAAAAINWLSMARTDGIYPIEGEGRTALQQAFQQCFSMGWPALLFLDEKQNGSIPKDLLRPLVPEIICCGVALLVVMGIPHTMLIVPREWSARLGLVTDCQYSAVRMGTFLLLLTVLYLTAAGCIDRSISVGTERAYALRFRAVSAVVCIAQLFGGEWLLPVLLQVAAVGLYPYIVITIFLLIGAVFTAGKERKV